MTVAASVFHPRRPQIELLSPGVELDRRLLARLKTLGVSGLWVDHDLTADLDPMINPSPSQALQTAFQQLRHDFAAIGRTTVSAGHVQTYRQIVMELVCELIANRHITTLTERLVSGSKSLFTHSANVAYLSISVGIELETYIVAQRRHMSNEHARDLTGLGIGAMLHDIGKVPLPNAVQQQSELNVLDAEGAAAPGIDGIGDEEGGYHTHPAVGFRMLRDCRAPASARQIVLNHHQRWDGSGFPDLRDATESRKEGTPRGREIHVFSRIVAAANVLDNLMRQNADGNGGSGSDDTDGFRPTIAALHAFASARFDGWFDPVVRDAMLRRVPPFPVGSHVILSDGRPAVVVAPSMEQPCRPTVRLLDEAAADQPAPGGGAVAPAVGDDGTAPSSPPIPTMDLCLDPSLHIVRCGGLPVEQWLYDIPDRCRVPVAEPCGT